LAHDGRQKKRKPDVQFPPESLRRQDGERESLNAEPHCPPPAAAMTLSPIASYMIQAATRPFRLTIARGSVVKFAYHPNPSRSAIVNAANETCLGGGGVDGAISAAGGPNLLSDRQSLPRVSYSDQGNNIRCPTGRAVITGPNNYDKLAVPFVIHAVGPNYSGYNPNDEEMLSMGDELLCSAYTSSMECCMRANLEAVAFSLLSAGVYRGSRGVQDVLRIGLSAICQFGGYEGLKEIYLCGFTTEEVDALVAIANEFGLNEIPTPDTNGAAKESTVDNNGNADSGTARNTEDSQEQHYLRYDQRQIEEQSEQDTREEWEVQRDELKSAADTYFRLKSYALAIQAYQDALQLDPTNHIILSNKSAAHLANGEKSKALHDARKCVEYASSWAKGHTRLAAAMASLGRYNEAATVYSKVLNEMEPSNAVALSGLEDCRLKQQSAREEKEREASRLQMELDRQKAEKEESGKRNNSASLEKGDEEDDLLEDFFSDVEKVSERPKSAKCDEGSGNRGDCAEETTNRIKTQLNDLGTSASQIDRLLQINYEWKNLNPFHVLDIPHDIDDDSIISARYRALSLLVHPDKCPDDPVRAKDAFEQVRKAMTHMNDTDKRRHVRALIEQGMKQGKRDWEAAKKASGSIGIGDSIKEQEALAQAQSKATMKIFAEIEQSRRNIERRKREFEKRERSQEDEEKAKEKNEREYDKRWREGERVEKRIGNWRDFQGGNEKGIKKGRSN
jgi:O-acetyl-ADP-ribose deacetylase (regulator of RNase III)